MYINSLFKFSLLIEARSSISLLLKYIQRSPEFTRLRLSRQNGQDSDLPCLNRKEKKISNCDRNMTDLEVSAMTELTTRLAYQSR